MDQEFDTSRMNQLIVQWRGGNAEARNDLIRLTLERMESLARRMLRDYPSVRRWEQTSDILQRAVLRLMRSLEAVDFQSTTDFFRLAAAQIRRELIDLSRHYRGNRGMPGSSPNAQTTDATDDGAPSTDELERWEAFHRAVEQLPIAERETFSLTFYHNWKQSQIAELLQVDERTIRRRWQSACLKLHEQLGDDLPM